jgi:iron complex outermembrane receptor protein
LHAGLGGLSAAALIAPAALAQGPLAGTAAPPAAVPVTAADQQTGAVENLTVTRKPHQAPGGGLIADTQAVKSVATTTRDFILKQPATTNPIRMLALQPGAVVASPDPFGIQPGAITVRGLNNGEIGWQFEGAPVNDGTLYPNEVVDAPNLEQVSLVPGSTDFDLPAASAAAGAVQILMHDPSHTRGGSVNLSYGSYHTHDEYIRLETGDIGNTGLRGFMSFSNVQGNDWRSPGQNTRTHIDSKFIKDWTNGSQSALSVAFNDINFQVERPPTLAQWKAQGVSFNYDRSFTPGDTNFYKLHQNPYKNVFITMPNTIVLTPKLKLYAIPYVYSGEGVIPGGTNLSPSSAYVGTDKVTGLQLHTNGNGTSASTPLLYSPTIPSLMRSGFNTNLRWDADKHNQLSVGYWYEYSERHGVGQYSYVGPGGYPADVWGDSNLVHLPSGAAYRFTDYIVRAQTNDLYLGDRMRFLDDRLAIDAGFKEIMFTQRSYNRIPGTTYNINNHQAEPMPSIGVRYDLTRHNQIFMDAGVNSKMPDPSQLVDAISPTSGKLTTQGGNAQKPEVSIVEELGYRYQGDLLVASATLFNYNFVNRQISTVVIENNAMITQYINAGGQTSRGVDVALGLRPFHHIRPFVSGEYLQATIDNNIARAGDLLPTAGKTATGAPRWTGNIGLDYDDGTIFGTFQMHYVSTQYSTFMNDEKLPSFETYDMSLGYRFHNFGPVKHPQLQLNLVNLDDHKFLTGINSTQFNARTVRGVYGTSIAGSAPSYLVGGGFAAIFAVSAGF